MGKYTDEEFLLKYESVAVKMVDYPDEFELHTLEYYPEPFQCFYFTGFHKGAGKVMRATIKEDKLIKYMKEKGIE